MQEAGQVPTFAAGSVGWRVGYSVKFDIDLQAIPEKARQEIEKTAQQIADVVSSIPLTSPFWSSMKDSVLQIDVGGYRIGYRIDPPHRVVRVIEAQPLR